MPKIFLRYPIPLFVASGLLLGVLLYFGVGEMPATWVWYATLIIGGTPIVYGTIKGMLKGQFASDIVAMLAIITALFLHQAFAGAVVVLMQSGGEAIEAYGRRRASSSLFSLLQRAPRFARRKKNDQIQEITTDEVQVGDLLLVRSGDLVPVDGIVETGIAEIDESAITGEPLDKIKRPGDLLLSGSVNKGDAFEMRSTKQAADSQYALIVKLVQKAQEEKAPIQRLADRYAIFFTPLTLFMAGLGFWLTRDPLTVLSVLVVATPCPLILATPLAVICGINRAADHSIIVKGGAALEQIARVKAVLFDKTGTITFGTPFVESVIPLANMPANEILYYAAIFEQMSSHSIAKAIVTKALETNAKLPMPEHFQEMPGQGIEGKIAGVHYLMGSHLFLQERGIVIKSPPTALGVSVFVVRAQECLGVIELTDQVRPRMADMIQDLRNLHVEEIAMLTGDARANGELIAKQVGIQRVEAELLPEQKVQIVREIGARLHPLVMVGDGINDAPALATATVGIALGATGTAISAEAADIVLLVDDPTKVVTAIQVGKRMLRVAKQSIWIGMGLSFALMLIAIQGYIVPAVGALLQEIIDVAVILNALRAR